MHLDQKQERKFYKRLIKEKPQPRRKDAIDEYEDGHDVYNDPTWKK